MGTTPRLPDDRGPCGVRPPARATDSVETVGPPQSRAAGFNRHRTCRYGS
jgi:hypothetical protein